MGIASGATALTRTPCGASSSASVLVKLSTAAFIAAYTPKPGAARDASIDVTLMIAAPGARSSRPARTKFVTLVKFSSTRACWPLALTSATGA